MQFCRTVRAICHCHQISAPMSHLQWGHGAVDLNHMLQSNPHATHCPHSAEAQPERAVCGAQSVVEKASIDEVYMDVTSLVDDELRSRESSRAPCEVGLQPVMHPADCHASGVDGPDLDVRLHLSWMVQLVESRLQAQHGPAKHGAGM